MKLNALPNSAANKFALTSTRLGDVLAEATHHLEQAGIENPSLDVRWLVGDTLKLDRTQLLLQTSRILTPHECALVSDVIDRRMHNVPVARILGEREFWGLPFGLNEATLEPRPDSETLIEYTLKHVANREDALRIADLGTGTGCLLLSLLHELPKATGLGIDISPRAVEQAQHNAQRLNLTARAEFKVNNWLDGINESFDIIISNPPYIPALTIPELMLEVRNHDPLRALDGGKDGLDPYRHIIPAFNNHLNLDGFVVLEVGQDQAALVVDILQSNHMTSITTHHDLGGVERCIIGFKKA